MKSVLFVKILLTALHYVVLYSPDVAGQVVLPSSARSQAMGNIGVTLTGAWSAFHNQAGLATVENTTFSLHYENHFLVAEMGSEAFILCLPSKSGTIGFSYSFYGFSACNEIKTGLAFGRSFGDKFRAGIEFIYLRIHQPSDYGNLHALVPGAGIQALPARNLIVAVHVFNPAYQHFSNQKSIRIPLIIRIGAGLQLGEEVLICTEMIKSPGVTNNYAAGIEHTVSDKLQARMGILFSEYAQPSFGIGFQAKMLQIDLSVRHHPVTGYSPSVSISILMNSGR